MKFQDAKGRQIEIQLADDYSEVVGRHNGSRIGAISFRHDWGDEPGIPEHLYITHLDISAPYCYAGIGSQMLEFVKSETGLPIVAADNDGIERGDGSHLTGDGPGFVAAMRRRGLVASSGREDADDRDLD